MLDGIPLGAACGIVSDGHAQSVAIGEVLLQLLLPHARSASITPSTICQNEYLLGFRIGDTSLFLPPTSKGCNCKFRCIRGRTNIHGSTIAKNIIDAVRNRFSHSILRKIMGIDDFWPLCPGSSSVLKIPDQLLLLRIYTDDGAIGCFKSLFLSLDLLKLG